MNFDINVILDNWHYFAIGLGKTILICFISLPIGFALGALLAMIRLRGGRVLNAAALGYIEIIRNIPFLVQVFLLFFALPFAGIRLSPMTAGIIALSSYGAAYFSEIVRGRHRLDREGTGRGRPRVGPHLYTDLLEGAVPADRRLRAARQH